MKRESKLLAKIEESVKGTQWMFELEPLKAPEPFKEIWDQIVKQKMSEFEEIGRVPELRLDEWKWRKLL